ncbi:hypothetical protein [Ramlibacter sp.]|uniref:hypothetical protein n=1 Tax=Ramlibacter sp. TaxID=1917967 RepID=UPI00181B7146|nr:hypothetical protein [Ramlibacter sp.]MBA2673011.1 hypothetical protein [Ramlibacter sp.]
MRFDPFDEYLTYLTSISFKFLIQDTNYKAASKRLHKRVLAFLVLEHQVTTTLEQADASTLLGSAAPFMAEFRSDLLSSLLIFEIGLYKAANMSARSGLENFFRVIAAQQGLDFRSVISVFDLIELTKQTPLRHQFIQYDQQLSTLISKYADLCKYVHSAGEEFLTLDRRLSEIPRWSSETGEAFVASLIQLVQAAISIMIYLNISSFRALRHDQRDVVLDALPAGFKAKLVQDIGML